LLKNLALLKRGLWLIAIGFFFCWLVDTWFDWTISQYENHNVKIKNEQQYKSQPFERRPIVSTIRSNLIGVWHWLETAHHEILSAFTIGLFGVTAALAWYTKDLAGRTRELALDAKESSRKELRAYLSVEMGSAIYQEIGNDKYFEARPTLVNSGKTPAKRLSYVARSEILQWPLNASFKLPLLVAQRDHKIMLAPGNPLIMNAFPDQWTLDAHVKDVMRANGKALYIWGVIRFFDVFDQMQLLNFCLAYHWYEGADGNEILGCTYIDGRNDAT